MSICDRFRFVPQKPILRTSSEVFALMDAATVHGAERYYFGYHYNPTWEYATQYSVSEDRLLFHELLRVILLYDQIFMDDPCVKSAGSIYRDVNQISRVMNDLAGFELLRCDALAPESALDQVFDAICSALRPQHPSEDRNILLSAIKIHWYYSTEKHAELRPRHRSEDKNLLLSTIKIPWYYSTEQHADYASCFIKY